MYNRKPISGCLETEEVGAGGAARKDYTDHQGTGGKSWGDFPLIVLMGSQCMRLSKLSESHTNTVFMCQLYLHKAIFKKDKIKGYT